MKRKFMGRKRGFLLIMFLLVMLFAVGSPASAKSKTVRLSAKTMTLQVGQTKTLKAVNGYPNIKWTVTSGRDVIELHMTEQYQTAGDAYVQVKGLKPGKATIKATAGKKTLKCIVTVKGKRFSAVKPSGFRVNILAEGEYNPKKKGYGFNFTWKPVAGADGYRLYKIRGSKKTLIKDIKGGNVDRYARRSLQVSGRELDRGKVKLQLVAYKIQNGRRIYSKAVTTTKYMVCV